MGSKKSSMLEKIREGDELGKQAIEAGEKLEGDGSEIKSLLDGIDTSMDEDDVSAVRGAEAGYSSDFKAAFSEQVETKGDEVKRIETDAAAESGEELEKVKGAAEKFQEMAHISDVGREHAEGAADSMQQSAAEYEEYVKESSTIVEDTQDDVRQLKDSIDDIFG